MEIKQQYALSAFRRAQDFLDENGAKVGALVDSEGRKLLDEAVEALQVHVLDQSSSALEIGGNVNLQKSLEAELRMQHMTPIANYARARLLGVPGFAALTRSPRNLKGDALVHAAQAMAKAAAPYAEALARSGFPADTIAQLDAAASNLQASIDGRANLKVRRVGATDGIDAQTAKGREGLKMLNAVIQRRFAKDRTFLAAWRSAKRINAKPGVTRGTTVATPVPSEVAISA